MPFGFLKQSRLVVYGDGEGNIVFEEYADNDCKILTARISMEWERFERLQNFSDDLEKEASLKNEG